MRKFWIFAICLMGLALSGCRSDADVMAEFCLNFVKATETEDCHQMASNLDALLSPEQPRIRDKSVCEKTTACLPCRKGVEVLLRNCGQNQEVIKRLQKEVQYSTTLKDHLTHQAEEGKK